MFTPIITSKEAQRWWSFRDFSLWTKYSIVLDGVPKVGMSIHHGDLDRAQHPVEHLDTSEGIAATVNFLCSVV
jgi:hypothetical protein